MPCFDTARRARTKATSTGSEITAANQNLRISVRYSRSLCAANVGRLGVVGDGRLLAGQLLALDRILVRRGRLGPFKRVPRRARARYLYPHEPVPRAAQGGRIGSAMVQHLRSATSLVSPPWKRMRWERSQSCQGVPCSGRNWPAKPR